MRANLSKLILRRKKNGIYFRFIAVYRMSYGILLCTVGHRKLIFLMFSLVIFTVRVFYSMYSSLYLLFIERRRSGSEAISAWQPIVSHI